MTLSSGEVWYDHSPENRECKKAGNGQATSQQHFQTVKIFCGSAEPRLANYAIFTFMEAEEPAMSDNSDDDSVGASVSESPEDDPFS